MKKPRIYVDTSVFGGCFDDEFQKESKKLFDEIRGGRFILIASSAILQELSKAPDNIKNLIASVPGEYLETPETTQEVRNLRDAYLAAKIVGKQSIVDAEHIAAASVFGADLIVSWNFKHIVHFDKIPRFQGVNLTLGYRPIPIYSPKEVVSYE